MCQRFQILQVFVQGGQLVRSVFGFALAGQFGIGRVGTDTRFGQGQFVLLQCAGRRLGRLGGHGARHGARIFGIHQQRRLGQTSGVFRKLLGLGNHGFAGFIAWNLCGFTQVWDPQHSARLDQVHIALDKSIRVGLEHGQHHLVQAGLAAQIANGQSRGCVSGSDLDGPVTGFPRWLIAFGSGLDCGRSQRCGGCVGFGGGWLSTWSLGVVDRRKAINRDVFGVQLDAGGIQGVGRSRCFDGPQGRSRGRDGLDQRGHNRQLRAVGRCEW